MQNYVRLGIYPRPSGPPLGSGLPGGPYGGGAGLQSPTSAFIGHHGGLLPSHLLAHGFTSPMNALTLAERLAGIYDLILFNNNTHAILICIMFNDDTVIN